MILDTSVLVTILQDEPEARHFSSLILDASHVRLSAGSWIEANAVAVRKRTFSPSGVQRLVDTFRIIIEPVTAEQARIGAEAYRRYGIGTGHPAKLNFGVCFAYALAKATGERLLYKGEDFVHTDVDAVR